MKNWEIQNLGKIFTISSGGTPIRNKPEYYINGNIPWVKTGDLKGKYVNKPDEFITEEALKYSSAKLFPPKTVLLAMYGATIGACSILPFEAATNQACAALLPTKKCNEIYLYYFLKSILHELITMGVGGAQPNISCGKIKQIQIPLPPLPIQQKIAAILDAADEYRQKTKSLIDKYDQLAQSLFFDMFGDPGLNVKGFENCFFDNVANQITDGDHTTPIRQSSGYKLLSCRNIKNGFIDFESGVDYVGDAEFQRMTKRCKPEKNDILISCSGTIGRTTVIKTDEPFVLVRSAALVKLKKDIVNPFYIEFYLRTSHMQAEMTRNANTSSQSNLFTGPIKKLPILIPPLSLQNQFAKRVQLVESQKQQAQASLLKAEELFNSLLQRAFKGELIHEKQSLYI